VVRSLLHPARIREWWTSLTPSLQIQTNRGGTMKLVFRKRMAAAEEATYQGRAEKISQARPLRLLFSCLLLEALMWPAAKAQTVPVSNPQLAATDLNARVEALLSQMTVEEKVGQLVQYVPGTTSGPDGSKLTYDDLIAMGQVGSMMYLVDAEKINHYQHIAMEKSRLHIPLIFAMDVIHGHRTTFPAPLAIAATWDPAAAERVAHYGAVEARADGITWVCSPMVDIARDPRWGRITESNGEDPYLGSAMARAWVKGYQQGDLTRPDSVAAGVKHFAAYGAVTAGREYNAVDMSEITLRQVYLEPYRAAVEAGAATVMSSYVSLNGVPASANPFLLKKVLREEWGFNGIVVSDDEAIKELRNHGIGADDATVARKALEAGVDMDMDGKLFGTVITPQVRAGKIPEPVLNEAVRHILRVKFALGLFEHPYAAAGPVYDATPERRAEARKVTEETFVLLKNDSVEGSGKLLPLKIKTQKVALIGPLADSQREMVDATSMTGDPKYVVTLRKALSERLGDRLLYAKGCGLLSGQDENMLDHVNDKGPAAADTHSTVSNDSESIAEAVKTAKKADVVVLALGESAYWMETEAASRTRLGFTGAQQQLLEAIAATGKPVILVVVAGRPLELTWAASHVPAILEAWSPGIEAGHAVADVLFGDVNPSGKLPASLPRAVGQEPLYYAQSPTGEPAHGDLSHLPRNPSEKFMSRYMDEENTALFPFGWGLSYTSFNYEHPTISRSKVPVGEILAPAHTPVATVGVDVKNTGSVTGTEVVQLYLRNTVSSVEQPVRELKGFVRVTLAPGEQKHIELPLGFNELNFYNVEIKRVVEPTTYKIWVGGSSLATAETSLQVSD
jgi:beta-glucosidase